MRWRALLRFQLGWADVPMDPPLARMLGTDRLRAELQHVAAGGQGCGPLRSRASNHQRALHCNGLGASAVLGGLCTAAYADSSSRVPNSLTSLWRNIAEAQGTGTLFSTSSQRVRLHALPCFLHICCSFLMTAQFGCVGGRGAWLDDDEHACVVAARGLLARKKSCCPCTVLL